MEDKYLARDQTKEELNFLESMLDLTQYNLKHTPDGKDAYNCDPCDGSGPSASYADIMLYERK